MRNIKLTIEYDGTHFHGWQIQSRGQRTVQGELEKALKLIFKQTIHLYGSGRTDSGVHALGQVANFKTSSPMPTASIVAALNANLPDDIVILQAKEASPDFHAQFNAKKKTYRYTILNRRERPCCDRDFVFHYPVPLNAPAMRKAAGILKGKNNFRSFMAANSGIDESSPKNTVRNISRLVIKERDHLITIEIEANGFLYKMVRNIVGTLLDVGKNKLTPAQVKKILMAKNRTLASSTVPAQGLCLLKVAY